MSESRAKVLAYLQAHHAMTLASLGEGGVWAAAVFYVNDGLRLYFLSAPTSRHSRNIAHDTRIAVTIQEDCADWPQIKGIQAEGRAAEIAGEEEKRARELYGAKFPIVGKLAQAPAAIVKAFAKVRWYRFEPEHLYFIDNSAGFGHREAVDCSAPA
ncbi:pyridoxamine 5'-phosphate oxidase family protein [Azoarcus sp. DN11]|uniref:pyridoxamine 5'-phosphate oxidase family protein n=1 Tax=Azoarcus sp. DN11 TaxID=356837 RepID=UPI000EABC178|nr:pyridoxamine 5'-phosphate oxidase family protein [Azoarcus sp. DN11]AYH44596.1 pyridoxamine 5'-phosphate oxidase [Azoarcus sp. DN11]